MSDQTSPTSTADALANALRTNDTREFGQISPVAACLIPLLQELQWHGDLRDVAEALPHFASDLDITDLRNALVCLGYGSEVRAMPVNAIDRRYLPCLFEEKNTGEISVIIGYDCGDYIVFKGGTRRRISFDEANQKGLAYLFTRRDATAEDRQEALTSWFTKVFLRFKSSLKSLLVISLITNLLAIAVPLFIMVIYDKVIGAQSTKTLPFMAAGIAVILASDFLFRAIRSQVIGSIAGRFDYLLGISAFEKIVSLPIGFTERATASSQISRLRQFESLREFFTGPLISSLLELPFVVLIITTIAIIAGPIAVLPIVGLCLYGLFGLLWLPHTKRLTRQLGQAVQDRQNFMLETATQLRTIKELGAEDIWRDRYRRLSSVTITLQNKTNVVNAVTQSVAHGIMMLSGLSVLGLGAYATVQGGLTIGGMIASMALVWKALGPAQSAFLALAKLSEIKTSLKQVNQLMRIKSEGSSQNTRLISRAYGGPVKLDRVSFRYTQDTDPALMSASVTFPQNSMTAIIGGNSSGKSTILKLITGIYKPQGGSVTIGGIDLRQIDPIDLRRKIAYVPQKPEIFYGTIAQNLRLADPLISHETMRDATDLVGLTKMIEALPDGFETRLKSTSSEALPIGFTHRLCIARALVRNANILLLDEPEQSLDQDGDSDLIEMLKSLKSHTTIVLVSHRPSHIRLADQAVVLNRGIVEYAGPPEQALKAMAILTGNTRAA